MENGKLTLAEIQITTEVSYITIKHLEIIGEENNHGKLSVILEVSEDVTAQEAHRLQGSCISVNLPDGICIFNGKCEDALMQDENGYHTIYIQAFTHSMDMDRTPMDRTFQNPSKTLEEVLAEVISPYGVELLLDQDQTIVHVISQKQETDWEFVKRLSGETGKMIYTDVSSDKIRIAIGKEGLYQFEEAVLRSSDVRKRDIDRLRYELQNGNTDAAAWQYDSRSAESDSLVVAVGSKSGNSFISGNRIYSDGNIVRNQVEVVRPEGLTPPFRQTATESIYNTVLTGTVLAVNKDKIQVEFDAPGGSGGNTWITYEAPINNAFYCMPDIGDSVFIYFQNNGKIICLGSARKDLSSPDYDKPEEKSLTSYDKMIRFKEEALHVTSTRIKYEQDSDLKMSILFEDSDGISINSGQDLTIAADLDLNFLVSCKEVGKEAETTESGKTKATKRHEANNLIYLSKGGDKGFEGVGYTDQVQRALSTMVDNEIADIKNSFIETGKQMIFYDIWGQGAETPTAVPEQKPIETGVLTLYGLNLLTFQVGGSFLELGQNISIDTQTFSWLGYIQNKHQEESDKLSDWWETGLDILQTVLDIAGFIPVWGFIPDLINAGISLARGDYAGALLSAVSAIPGYGDAVGGFKMMAKTAKFLDTYTGVAKALKITQLFYALANVGASFYRNWEEISKFNYKIWEWQREDWDRFNLILQTGSSMYGVKEAAGGLRNSRPDGTRPNGDPDGTSGRPNGDPDTPSSRPGGDTDAPNGRPNGDSDTPSGRPNGEPDTPSSRPGGDTDAPSGRPNGDSDTPSGRPNGEPDTPSSRPRDPDGPDSRRPDNDGNRQRDDSGDPNETRETGGDPINLVTGSQSIVHTDIRMEDITQPFKLKRWYESVHANHGGLLGSKWYLQIETRIRKKDNQYKVQMPDMHIETFEKTDGKFLNVRKGEGYLVLTEIEQGYLLKDKQKRIVYAYNQEGKLISITDRNDNQTTLEYIGNSLTKLILASGQSLQFYYENNQVSRICDQIGRSISYHYQGEFLKTVTYPNNGTITYEYTPEGYISSIVDQNGTKFVTNHYDYKGRVIRQEVPGEEYILFYDDANRKNTFTTLSGNKTEIIHYNAKHMPVKTEYDDGTYREVRYDQWENVIYERKRNDSETYRDYDVDGNLLRETLSNGMITEHVYDISGNRIRTFDNSGGDIRYEYDNRRNLTVKKLLLEADLWQISTYTLDARGHLTKLRDGKGNEMVYSYEYDISLPSSYVDALGNETLYRYDEVGRLMEVIKGEGKVSFGYNLSNCKTIMTDEEGNTTRYVYDRMNNLIEEILPNEYQNGSNSLPGTRYEYDQMDRLIRTITPDNVIFAQHKDAQGRVLKEIHPNGYDPDQKNGVGTSYQYDRDGNMTHINHWDGGCTRFFYDSAGNLLKKILPIEYGKNGDNGKGYLYLYDCMDQLVQITNPEDTVEKRYLYDLNGSVIKEIDAQGYAMGQTDEDRPGILYQYNHCGWLLEKREPIHAEVIGESQNIQYRLTRYEYDLCGDMVAEYRYLDHQNKTSRNGRLQRISYFYDKLHRLLKVEDGIGSMLCYSYDRYGRRISERKKICEDCWQETLYHYDKAGRVIEIATSADPGINGKNYASTFLTYDANGNNTKIVTPSGYQIIKAYDRGNRLVKEEHIEKHGDIHNIINYQYDKAGNVTSIESGNGSRISFDYDYYNREIKKVNADGGILLRRYDREGKLNQFITPNEYQLQGEKASGYNYSYDNLGRMLSATGPDGTILKQKTYTAWGAVETEMNGLGNGLRYQYDLGNRRIDAVTETGSRQRYVYNAVGHLIGSEDGNGNRTGYELDLWGRVTSIHKADGNRETYSYDFAGNVTSSTDGEGNQTLYTFNTLNKIAQRTDSAGETEFFYYDPEGRVCEYVDRNGEHIHYQYNLYGNITRKENGDRTLQEIYGYTAEGSIKFAMGGGMRYDYQYYDNGLLKEKRASGRTLLSYVYDLNGNKIAQRDLTGKQVEFNYNSLDLLTEVYDNGTRQALYEYNQDLTIRKLTIGADMVSEYGYDQDQNITSLYSSFSEQVLADNHYTFDGNGNYRSKTTLEGQTSYSYDPLNRLVKAAYPGSEESYDYDQSGNRVRQLTGDLEELYCYDQLNRLSERSVRRGEQIQTYQYCYDKQGNLLKDDKTEYRYNSFNYVERVRTVDGSTQVNRYDAEGLRYEMEENGRLVQFLFSGQEVVAETEEDGNIIRYLRGYQIISSDSEKAKTYYHYSSDEMGSITHIASGDDGQVLNEYQYDAFGNTVYEQETVKNRFRYTGQQYDSVTGQYYLRARFYNPVIGRFTQEDTYYGDGLNLYVYCANNPVGHYDPSGYCDEKFDNTNRQDNGNDPSRPQDPEHTAPPGYYQDEKTGRWHRPNGDYASNAEVGLPPPGSNRPPSSGDSGGRLGSSETRAQNRQIADYLESVGGELRGGGGGQALGGLPEEYLPGPNGGNKGSNYVDVTVVIDGQTIRINTVDIDAQGAPTTREAAARDAINRKIEAQGDIPIILIPKGAGLGDLPNIINGLLGR